MKFNAFVNRLSLQSKLMSTCTINKKEWKPAFKNKVAVISTNTSSFNYQSLSALLRANPLVSDLHLFSKSNFNLNSKFVKNLSVIDANAKITCSKDEIEAIQNAHVVVVESDDATTLLQAALAWIHHSPHAYFIIISRKINILFPFIDACVCSIRANFNRRRLFGVCGYLESYAMTIINKMKGSSNCKISIDGGLTANTCIVTDVTSTENHKLTQDEICELTRRIKAFLNNDIEQQTNLVVYHAQDFINAIMISRLKYETIVPVFHRPRHSNIARYCINHVILKANNVVEDDLNRAMPIYNVNQFEIEALNRDINEGLDMASDFGCKLRHMGKPYSLASDGKQSIKQYRRQAATRAVSLSRLSAKTLTSRDNV
ncbi:hypothetical protein GJ496_011020 [Pomphorhynchus laevis]|nr:hypothetical protein GJ496_011020 [Pomphorhynchus laevis]